MEGKEDNDQFSERPPDSDFQQQNLKAWQPLLTPKWVIGTFVIIAVTFAALGTVIIVHSQKCQELPKKYNDLKCDDKEMEEPCLKTLKITVEEDMGGPDQPVYFYYKLTNFYQNHRRYVKSRNDKQLQGTVPENLTAAEETELQTSCDALVDWEDTGNCGSIKDCPKSYECDLSGDSRCWKECTSDDDCKTDSKSAVYKCNDDDRCVVDPKNKPPPARKFLYPCGLIANSYFNDTFMASLTNKSSKVSTTINWTDTGIAWPSDKAEKFKAPSTALSYNTYTRIGPSQHELPDVTDEAFIVWMRTAGLSTFKKLRYRILDQQFKKGDVITVQIMDNFPTKDFDGEKWVVFSTTSWLGGKNEFLGFAYITVASLCFLFAIIFGLKHCLCPRELGDMKYFSWENSRK